MGERPELSALTTADGGWLRFAPFTVGGEQWLKFAEQTPGATFYHRRPWLDLLRAAHGSIFRSRPWNTVLPRWQDVCSHGNTSGNRKEDLWAAGALAPIDRLSGERAQALQFR